MGGQEGSGLPYRVPGEPLHTKPHPPKKPHINQGYGTGAFTALRPIGTPQGWHAGPNGLWRGAGKHLNPPETPLTTTLIEGNRSSLTSRPPKIPRTPGLARDVFSARGQRRSHHMSECSHQVRGCYPFSGTVRDQIMQ